MTSLHVDDELNFFLVMLMNVFLKCRTDKVGEKSSMVDESKVEECCSVNIIHTGVGGTRIDTKVAVLAQTEGGLIARVFYCGFGRCMIRRSGRKGCRDVVGAIVVVDRVKTTIKQKCQENTKVPRRRYKIPTRKDRQ